MQVTRGRILAQRIFDVADEVRLAEAEALLRRTSDQLSFVTTASRIRNTQPPLQVVLDAGFAGVDGLAARSVVTRVYDLGAVVVTFDIPLPGPMSGEELIAFAARVLDAEERITNEARPIAEGIARAVASASRIAEVATIVEDYTVIIVEATEPKVTGDELMRELDVARLLLGEKSTIAHSERGHVTRQSFSYNPDELVVLDWNSALIVDPRGGLEVADVIELATMQLLGAARLRSDRATPADAPLQRDRWPQASWLLVASLPSTVARHHALVRRPVRAHGPLRQLVTDDRRYVAGAHSSRRRRRVRYSALAAYAR